MKKEKMKTNKEKRKRRRKKEEGKKNIVCRVHRTAQHTGTRSLALHHTKQRQLQIFAPELTCERSTHADVGLDSYDES